MRLHELEDLGGIASVSGANQAAAFDKIALEFELPHLAAQPPDLLMLGAGQTVALTRVDFGLLDRVANRLLARFEILAQVL